MVSFHLSLAKSTASLLIVPDILIAEDHHDTPSRRISFIPDMIFLKIFY